MKLNLLGRLSGWVYARDGGVVTAYY